jgi:SAM-dependent methyltransferase
MVKKIMRLYRAGTLGLAIKGEIGDWVSAWGSRIGSERIIYNSWTYAIFHRAALEASPVMVQGIFNVFPEISSVADFGCGTGAYVAEFAKRGVAAEGFEYSDVARKLARESFNLELKPFDLTTFTDAGRTFDLAISFEVAEHLTPVLGDRLVDVCCQHAPLVIFTAAHPGQTGQGHINLQPKSYWIERFARRGFQLTKSTTDQLERYLRTNLMRGFWLADNIGVYELSVGRSQQ